MRNLGQTVRMHWQTVSAVAALCADAGILMTAFMIARAGSASGAGSSLPGFCIAVFLLAAMATGLTRIVARAPVRTHVTLALKTYLYGAGIIAGSLFLVGAPADRRGILALFFLTIPPVYAMVWMGLRVLLGHLRSRGFGSWRTLLIGEGPDIGKVLRRTAACPELGYRIVRAVAAVPGAGGGEEAVREILGDPAYRIDHVVLSAPHGTAASGTLVGFCRDAGVRVTVLSAESEELFRRARIDDPAGIPLFRPGTRTLDRFKGYVKRIFDLSVALLLLLLSAPVFLTIAAATALESRGPVIFRQRRALAMDRPSFEVYKFRSMLHGTENDRSALNGRNQSDGALFKIREDPRRTRVGRFLRRHSLDELPQLVNVVKGEMSLVGPRPLPLEDFSRLDGTDHLAGWMRHRARSRPGMTGLWQVSGRSDLGFHDMVLLDLYYAEHQSILFDMEILVRTLPVVLFGRGAY